MVNVHQKMDGGGRLDNLTAVEGRLLQIERTHKLILIGGQGLIGHLCDGHLDRHAVRHCLHDGVALGSKVDAQFRMSLHNLLHDIGQTLRLYPCRESEQIGDVVDGRRGVLQTFEVDAGLGVAEGGSLGGLGCLGSLGSRRRLGLHQTLQDFVLDALQSACLNQRLRVEGHAVALVHQDGEADGGDGGQPGIAEDGGDAEVGIVDDAGNHLVQLLLQDIQRGLLCRLRHCRRTADRLGQGALVHLLVLVQGDGVNLHRHGGNHIGRLLVKDEAVQSLDVHLLVADDIGSHELSVSTFLVEGLHGGILDAGELADDGLDLFQFDAEAADFHLSVATAHKLDVAGGQVADDVTRAVAAGVFLAFAGKGITDKHLSRLLWAVQVATAHLRAAHPQFTGSTNGQTVALRVDDVEPDIVERLADGDFLHLLRHVVAGDEDGRLRRSIDIIELIALWRRDGRQFLAARRKELQRVVLDV